MGISRNNTALIRELLRENPLTLAPMAGVSDSIFRSICRRHGAGLTYTEMVSAQGLNYANEQTRSLLEITDEEKPVGVQLFGSDPSILADQACALERMLGERLFLIDINMGCPARKVIRKGEGSALMKDPHLAARIIESVSEAVTIPVTVKFRRGFEADEDSAVPFAVMAQESGAAAVAVHGRTTAQKYTGTSDWKTIARVKRALTIPVIASGDLFSPQAVVDCLAQTGADGVMLARGARGNPWLFDRTHALLRGDERASLAPATLEERVAQARLHARALAARDERSLIRMRKHVSWYMTGTSHARVARRYATRCSTLAEFEALFDALLVPDGLRLLTGEEMHTDG